MLLTNVTLINSIETKVEIDFVLVVNIEFECVLEDDFVLKIIGDWSFSLRKELSFISSLFRYCG